MHKLSEVGFSDCFRHNSNDFADIVDANECGVTVVSCTLGKSSGCVAERFLVGKLRVLAKHTEYGVASLA
jgi:hypothetical protein